jgi:hypothetical protein
MKHVVLVGALIVALAVPALVVSGQTAPAGGTSLGSVTLNRQVMVDGKPLAPGTYQVRLSADMPKPGVGQSPEGERYVEFVRGGKVAARDVATVVSAADIGQIAKGARPPAGGSKVELLKGNDYLRVWINRGGMNYLIHLPTAA